MMVRPKLTRQGVAFRRRERWADEAVAGTKKKSRKNWERLLQDMRKRRVLPGVETMLWYYAKGQPVERHEIATPGDFSKLRDEELLAQFEAMVMSLRAERRVDGDKELLSLPAPTTV
jgi:hypothetical protein